MRAADPVGIHIERPLRLSYSRHNWNGSTAFRRSFQYQKFTKIHL